MHQNGKNVLKWEKTAKGSKITVHRKMNKVVKMSEAGESHKTLGAAEFFKTMETITTVKLYKVKFAQTVKTAHKVLYSCSSILIYFPLWT